MSNRSDNFNRSDGSIGTPSDGGSAWSVLSGTWDILSNQARESGGGSQTVTVLESSETDGDVQVTLATVGSDSGIIGRADDDNNYFLVNSGGFLYTRSGGGFTLLASGGGAWSNGDVVKIHFAGGSAIEFFLNGSSVISTTNSDHSTATKHGIRAHNSTNARFDDFSFTGAGGGGGGLVGPLAFGGRLVHGSLIRGGVLAP